MKSAVPSRVLLLAGQGRSPRGHGARAAGASAAAGGGARGAAGSSTVAFLPTDSTLRRNDLTASGDVCCSSRGKLNYHCYDMSRAMIMTIFTSCDARTSTLRSQIPRQLATAKRRSSSSGATGGAQSVSERARPAAARCRRRRRRWRSAHSGEQLPVLQSSHSCTLGTPCLCAVPGLHIQQGKRYYTHLRAPAAKQPCMMPAPGARCKRRYQPRASTSVTSSAALSRPTDNIFAGSVAQGVEQLDDAGAGALAALLALVRGPQAPGAAASHCRVVTADFMADVYTVCSPFVLVTAITAPWTAARRCLHVDCELAAREAANSQAQ